MDFVRLVESGKYRKEELNDKEKSFIDGIEFAEKQLDNMFDDGDFDSFSPTLAKIQRELAEECIRIVKEYLYVTKCEMIVEMLDEQSVTEVR